MDAFILLAGGSGQRAGLGSNKVYHALAGHPLLAYPLRAIRAIATPIEVVVVVRREDRSLIDRVLAEFSDLNPRAVLGGSTRHESELAGIAAVKASETALIGIHDAARPFLTADLWRSLRARAAATGGAIPVVDSGPVFEPVAGQLRRLTGVVKAQTPQVFLGAEVALAYGKATRPGFDTAETVARFGRVAIGAVAGDQRNLKVTTLSDFDRAAALASEWSPERWLVP